MDKIHCSLFDVQPRINYKWFLLRATILSVFSVIMQGEIHCQNSRETNFRSYRCPSKTWSNTPTKYSICEKITTFSSSLLLSFSAPPHLWRTKAGEAGQRTLDTPQVWLEHIVTKSVPPRRPDHHRSKNVRVLRARYSFLNGSEVLQNPAVIKAGHWPAQAVCYHPDSAIRVWVNPFSWLAGKYPLKRWILSVIYPLNEK